MWEMRLYLVQRATAVLMVPLILGHLYTIFQATSDQLTASDILARTQGHAGWAFLYGLFVVLAAVHGAIGVRSVVRDWSGLRGASLDWLMGGVGLLLMLLGFRAVIAVTMP